MLRQLAEAIQHYTERQTGSSPFATAIEGVFVLRADHPKPPTHRVFGPAICIVAQGAKWAAFGGHRLEYGAGQALVVGVETPSFGRVIEASASRPCLVMAIALDLAIMRDLAEDLASPPEPAREICRGVFVTDFQGPLADCALRLVHLLDRPEAIPTLYPMIMREICYWLLTGPHGREIARMSLANSPSERVMSAMTRLRERFSEPVRIEELAGVAQMSPSAFHRQFKALTSLTPLQYQKQLRLLAARRLMIASAVNVEAAAFEVGYESPSQFSREYSRMFGVSPKRDAQHRKAALVPA